MDREGMPLHDTVGINCKNGANTENQGSKGYIVMTVCVINIIIRLFEVFRFQLLSTLTANDLQLPD